MGGSLTLFVVRKIGLIHTAYLIFFKLQPMLQVFLHVEGVTLIEIRCELIVRVLRDVVFVREKWTDTAKLEDTLASVQHGQLVNAHQLLAELLIIKAVRNLPATALASIEGVDCLFAQGSCQFFERGRLFAAEEDGAVMR